MTFNEHVTPGWSVSNPPSSPHSVSPVKKQPGRPSTTRVYPSWCLAYPPKPALPPGSAAVSEDSDVAERLLRQVFG